jgi:hypothetical protein
MEPMPSARELKSVAHNTAHHAASSLSWMHPHACRAARAAGIGKLQFDLLNSAPLAIDALTDPLQLATRALKARFVQILCQQGFQPDTLREASLVMRFPRDEHYCVATCRLETVSGKVFEKTSTSLG